MVVKSARLELIWENGRRVDMGTLDVTADEAEIRKQVGHIRQRIGWELVRAGLKFMLPGRKWATDLTQSEPGD